MKACIVLIIFFNFFSIFASETKYQIWGTGKNYYAFSVESSTRALVSANCLDSIEKCKAIMAKKTPKKITITQAQLSGGKNPSSLLCSLGHHGEVVVLQDSKGNENSFCLFADHTMISASDLDR
ncbi:MAG: hypothetical protein PHY93_15215 [Bacteriovorax sp.]|nr:hypothetical protein [Bacteriovorax sp.]